MTTRNNPARYDPVIKVTPQEAELNKRTMGKKDAAERDPRGEDPFGHKQTDEKPDVNPDSSEDAKPES